MLSDKTYLQYRRVVEKIKKNIAWYLGRRKTTYVWDRVPFYKKMWAAAASRSSLNLVALTDDVWDLRDDDGETLARINNCYVELDDPVTLHVAGDKAITYSLLGAAGLSVAPHASFDIDSLDTLRSFVDQHPGPFVIKPASGTGSGIGVTTHLRDYDSCLKSTAIASLYCRDIIIEQFIAGEVYRLLVVNGEVVSCARRTGIRIATDGTSSIAALVSIQHPMIWSARNDDLDLQTTLDLQGLVEDTVVPNGRQVLVKSVAQTFVDNVEIRTVYDVDVSDDICADIKDAASRASRVLRSEFCGVDMILLDPDAPLGEGNGVIGEVNTTPGLHHHVHSQDDDDDSDSNAADRVLQHIRMTRQHAN